MSIRIWLYSKIISASKSLIGYFEPKLGEHYTKQNVEHANAFLEKFRARRDFKKYPLTKKASLNPFCFHLKGGRIRSKNSDYNVGMHTFPDGTTKIWCLNGCGFVSYRGDANWKTAVGMLNRSSNTASASERVMWGTSKDIVVVTAQDTVPNVGA